MIIGYSFENSDRAFAKAFSIAFRSAGLEKSVSGSFLNFESAIADSYVHFVKALMTALCTLGRTSNSLELFRVG